MYKLGFVKGFLGLLVYGILLLVSGPMQARICTDDHDERSDSFDILRTDIYLDMTDWSAKVLNGYTELQLIKSSNAQQLSLDLLLLEVDSVLVDGVPQSFVYNDTNLDLNFSAISLDTHIVRVYYHGTPWHYILDWGGFYWSTDYAFNIGVSFREVPHNYGRIWFPCFDNFTERSFINCHITTPSDKRAQCGGRLVRIDTGFSNYTWHWELAEPIPSYLASVTVANYQILRDTFSSTTGLLAVELAALASDAADMQGSFANLERMLDGFEEDFGRYQWERIGYCNSPFGAGAMEHATNITYMSALVEGTTYYESTIAHELSHHWFGDLVTCDKASEMWLNEGWAVYSEHIYAENAHGRGAYDTLVEDLHASNLQFMHTPSVDSFYYAVNAIPPRKTYSSTVYEKGADIAHTLRGYMGDSLFFNGIEAYLSHFSFRHSNSDSMQEFLSDYSGMPLEHFFDDWVKNGGWPHFAIVDVQQNLNATDDEMHVLIRQRLNHAPHYYNQVPLTISVFVYPDVFGGAIERYDFPVVMSGECMQFDLPAFPEGLVAYVGLDLDNRISDAITSQTVWAYSEGSIDLASAKCEVDIHALQDSILLRIEHNWVAADSFRVNRNGLHLHGYRFWTVGGVNIDSDSTNLTGHFTYDGTLSGVSGYLDNTMMTRPEDSLVMMYRPNEQSDWVEADSFEIDFQGSHSNKRGRIDVYGLRSGEYAMAIWDHSRADEPLNGALKCQISVGLSSNHKQLNPGILIYPNPGLGLIKVSAPEIQMKGEWLVLDAQGKELYQMPSDNLSIEAEMDLRHLPKGWYFLNARTDGYSRLATTIIIH